MKDISSFIVIHSYYLAVLFMKEKLALKHSPLRNPPRNQGFCVFS